MKKVLLVNWDSYPHVSYGGVYAWEKSLIESIADFEFIVINLLSNPNANGKYIVPSNVSQIIEMPLFGSQRPEEFYGKRQNTLSRIIRTNDNVIEDKFIPIYRDYIDSALSDESDTDRTASLCYQLHNFFSRYDVKKCSEHPITWQTFMAQLDKDFLFRQMKLREALTAFQIIQRNLQILALDIPKTDIVHSSLAWIPSMIAICSKFKHNIPVIVTEHGVAFRELLLYYNAYLTDEPSNVFWKLFSKNIISMIYSKADLVTPVCEANAEWERNLGVPSSKIKVIYNGVDINRFKPSIQSNDTSQGEQKPTVVCVGRVDVFKDIINLINAISHVRRKISNIQCLIYGAATDLEYSYRCIDAVAELGLEENVRFMGKTKDPQDAYNKADVIVISSITEGFPFAVIEAMACGRAVVATDVGGVREALQDCGLLVRSNQPQELGEAILRLLGDQTLRKTLGEAAQAKVHNSFTLDRSISQYKLIYNELIEKNHASHINCAISSIRRGK